MRTEKSVADLRDTKARGAEKAAGSGRTPRPPGAPESAVVRRSWVAGIGLAAVFVAAVVLLQLAEPQFALVCAGPVVARAWAKGLSMAAVGVLCVAWGVWTCHRCPDASIRRNIRVVVGLLVGWLLVMTVKWALDVDRLESVLWYLYYVPMLCVPTLGLFCVARAAAVDRSATARAVKCALMAGDVVLVCFVLTNNLHRQVFVFDFANPEWPGEYGYAWGYAVVMGWIGLQLVLLLVLAYTASARALHGAVAVVGILLALVGTFAVCYVLDVWGFRWNLAVSCSALTMATFEACFDLGILPSYRRWGEMFARLPFDLKVLGPDLRPVFATDCARPLEPAVRARLDWMRGQGVRRGGFEVPSCPHRTYRAFPVEGGTALLTEDVSSVDARRVALEEKRAQLRARNALLEQNRAVQARLHRQRSEQMLCDEVERALERATRRMGVLIDELGEPGANRLDGAGRHARFAELRLLLAYSKRKGALVLMGAGDPVLDAARLELIADETRADLRAAGLTCGFVCDVDAPVDVAAVSQLYDCLCACALAAVGHADPVLMARLTGGGARAELRVAVEVADGADLGAALRDGALRLRGEARAAECTCAVEASSGELHVAARVCGGGAEGPR